MLKRDSLYVRQWRQLSFFLKYTYRIIHIKFKLIIRTAQRFRKDKNEPFLIYIREKVYIFLFLPSDLRGYPSRISSSLTIILAEFVMQAPANSRIDRNYSPTLEEQDIAEAYLTEITTISANTPARTNSRCDVCTEHSKGVQYYLGVPLLSRY